MPNENSLFRRITSLFRRKFSLFGCVGNSIKKASRYRPLEGPINVESPESGKFPVFSLDNRESAVENSSLVTVPTAN